MRTAQPTAAAIDRFVIARNDLILAHAEWKLFRDLYRTSKEDIGVLSAVTGWGWATIHNLLIDSIILLITRLVDKRRGTLSLVSIVRQVSTDRATAKQLEADLQAVMAGVETLKLHRDNRVSHNNLECALDSRKLPRLDDEQFEKGLKSIGELMNKIGEQLGLDPYLEFEPVMEPTGFSIVMYLRFGLEIVKLGQQVALRTISKDELFEKVRKYA